MSYMRLEKVSSLRGFDTSMFLDQQPKPEQVLLFLCSRQDLFRSVWSRFLVKESEKQIVGGARHEKQNTEP